MLPLDIAADFGKYIGYLTFFFIGISFGGVLEMAGFGDSRKLASQFYFKDMTVLKTMFTGILVALLLLFLSSALGLLEFSKIFVNQTYLWPGIVGGLIMGVGFIVGGYCPGTSVVSAASFKLDGLTFFIGTMIGAGLFGEHVPYISDFWNSSFTERLLVSDWLGWSVGATVIGVAVLALSMFYGAEKAEEYFQEGKVSWKPKNKKYMASAAIVIAVAFLTWAIGEPTADKKWKLMGKNYQALLDSREIFIHPLEYVKSWNDASIKLITLDLRPESEFRKFHLDSAKSVTLDDLEDKDFLFDILQLPPQGLVVLVSDNEEISKTAWKKLKVQGVSNLYILESGLTNWNQMFSGKVINHKLLDPARPPVEILEMFPKDIYKTKIKLKTTKKGGGLCS